MKTQIGIREIKILKDFNKFSAQEREKYIADVKQKAESGDEMALYWSGYLNISLDLEKLKKAALSKDPELYYIYIYTKTVTCVFSPAACMEFHRLCYWGRKLAYAPILNRLAISYLCGIGCRQNTKLAKKYFSQAAELGSEAAANNLIEMEEQDISFWMARKYWCMLSSELSDVAMLDRFSINIAGTFQPGKTTLLNSGEEKSNGQKKARNTCGSLGGLNSGNSGCSSLFE